MEEEESELFCHNCQKSVPAANFATHSVHCEKHIKICKLCNEPIPITGEAEHLQESHVTVACDLCGVPFEKWMHVKHEELCSRRLVHCEFCDSEFPFNEHAEHTDFCSSRTEKCMLCQKYIMRKDEKKHTELHLSERRFQHLAVDSEVKQNIINEVITDSIVGRNTPEKELCTERMVPCEFCDSEFLFEEYERHLDNCSSRTEQCMLCPEFIKLKDKEKHVEAHIVHQDRLNSERAKASQNEARGKSRVPAGASAMTDESIEELSRERVAPCEYCGLEFPFEDFVKHLDFCSSKTVKCALCPKYVILKDREKHREEHMRDPRGLISERPAVSQNDATSNSRFLSGASAVTDKSDQMSKRYGVCHICHATIPWIDMNVHIPNCASDAGKCSACGEEVPGHAMKEHIINKKCKKLSGKDPSCAKSDLDSTSRYGSGSVAQNDLVEGLPLKKCPYCNQMCSAGRISEHVRNCSENCYECPICFEKMSERDKVSHESFYCKTLLEMKDSGCFGDLSDMDSLKTSHKEKASEKPKFSKNYTTCYQCGNQMRAERIEDHLLVCQKNLKKPCIYCKEKIHVKDEENHLLRCKEFQSILKKPDYRQTNNFRGAVPKNSKFSQMANIQTANCKFCDTTLNSDILFYHEEQCVHKMVPCEKCCVLVKLKDRDHHICNSKKGKKKNNESNTGVTQHIKNFLGFGQSKSNDAHSYPGHQIEHSSQTYNDNYPPLGYNNYISSGYNNYIPPSYSNYMPPSYSNYMPPNYSNYIPSSCNYNDYQFSKPESDEPSIPCEFCGELFSMSEIILHSTGCNPDEIYKRRDTSEDVKRSEQNSNKSNHLQSSLTAESFFPPKSQKDFSSARFEKKKHLQTTVGQGEFLKNHSPESISSKPEVAVECHEKESLNGSKNKIRSVWNVSPEPVEEEMDLKIFPPNSLSEKMTTDQQGGKGEVSDSKPAVEDVSPEPLEEEMDLKIFPSKSLSKRITTDQRCGMGEVSGNKQAVEEEDDEMSSIFDFLSNDKTSASGRGSPELSDNDDYDGDLKEHGCTVSEKNGCHDRKAFKIEPSANASQSSDRLYLRGSSSRKCLEVEQVSENDEDHPQVHDFSKKKNDSRRPVAEDVKRWTKWRGKSSDSI